MLSLRKFCAALRNGAGGPAEDLIVKALVDGVRTPAVDLYLGQHWHRPVCDLAAKKINAPQQSIRPAERGGKAISTVAYLSDYHLDAHRKRPDLSAQLAKRLADLCTLRDMPAD